jgi:hypothetical protein
MKVHAVILLFVNLMIGTVTFAQTVEGSMECTVTGVSVVSSEEGRHKIYSNIEGGVKSNEKLILTYRANSVLRSISVKLERAIEAKDKIIVGEFFITDSADIKVERVEGRGYVFKDKEHGHSVSLLEDYIRIANFSTLLLYRYHKNDWHGIYSRIYNFDMTVLTLTLDCRHRNDRMADAWAIFEKSKGRK